MYVVQMNHFGAHLIQALNEAPCSPSRAPSLIIEQPRFEGMVVEGDVAAYPNGLTVVGSVTSSIGKYVVVATTHRFVHDGTRDHCYATRAS